MNEDRKTYLMTLHPVRFDMPYSPTEAEQEIVGRHFERLKLLTDEGKVIFVGRTLEEPITGIAVFYAKDDLEAAEFVKEDPAVAENIMTGDVQLFHIALQAKSP